MTVADATTVEAAQEPTGPTSKEVAAASRTTDARVTRISRGPLQFSNGRTLVQTAVKRGLLLSSQVPNGQAQAASIPLALAVNGQVQAASALPAVVGVNAPAAALGPVAVVVEDPAVAGTRTVGTPATPRSPSLDLECNR
jgi:hypothetical protein